MPFISAARRSSTEDTCSECKPGEAALTIEQLVGSTGSAPPTAAACTPDLAARLDRVAALLAAAGVSDVAPLLSGQGGAIQRLQGTSAAEETATLVTPLLRRDAVCQTLIAVLPPGAEYTGYSYEASDAFSSGPCTAGEECAIGSASFLGEPTVIHTAGPTVVYGVFHNQSQGRQRRARMTIYYSP